MIIYAYLDAERRPHEVPAGQDFATPLQRIDTAEESVAALGAPIGSYVACEIQHRFSDLAGYDDATLARWAIQRVSAADPAAGRKVVGRTLSVDDAGLISLELETEAFASPEVAALKAQRAAAIRAEAGRRIDALMADRAQKRAMARGLFLLLTVGGPETWSDADKAQLQAALATWTQIEAIEAAEDAIVAALPDDAAGIAAVTVADNPAWPS